MNRKPHPNKHIEGAVQYAESKGWIFRKGSSHAWGVLKCPHGEREGCQVSVYSTPRVPENHAKHIRNAVDKCNHEQES